MNKLFIVSTTLMALEEEGVKISEEAARKVILKVVDNIEKDREEILNEMGKVAGSVARVIGDALRGVGEAFKDVGKAIEKGKTTEKVEEPKTEAK